MKERNAYTQYEQIERVNSQTGAIEKIWRPVERTIISYGQRRASRNLSKWGIAQNIVELVVFPSDEEQNEGKTKQT